MGWKVVRLPLETANLPKSISSFIKTSYPEVLGTVPENRLEYKHDYDDVAIETLDDLLGPITQSNAPIGCFGTGVPTVIDRNFYVFPILSLVGDLLQGNPRIAEEIRNYEDPVTALDCGEFKAPPAEYGLYRVIASFVSASRGPGTGGQIVQIFW